MKLKQLIDSYVAKSTDKSDWFIALQTTPEKTKVPPIITMFIKVLARNERLTDADFDVFYHDVDELKSINKPLHDIILYCVLKDICARISNSSYKEKIERYISSVESSTLAENAPSKPASKMLKRANATSRFHAPVANRTQIPDDHALSFKNLSQINREGTRHIASGDYTAYIGESPKFLIVQCTSESKFAELDKVHQDAKAKDAKMGITDREGSIGWKIHISVAKEDVEKAWPIIRAIMMEHRVSTLKITNPKTFAEAIANPLNERLQSVTEAKQFTIYADSDNYTPEKWQTIMQQVEVSLRKNNIKPASHLPAANKQIEGSAYITYRNDAALFQNYGDNDDKPTYKARYYADDEAEFVSARCNSLSEQKSPYNISGFPDPFARITFRLANKSVLPDDQPLSQQPILVYDEIEQSALAEYNTEQKNVNKIPIVPRNLNSGWPLLQVSLLSPVKEGESIKYENVLGGGKCHDFAIGLFSLAALLAHIPTGKVEFRTNTNSRAKPVQLKPAEINLNNIETFLSGYTFLYQALGIEITYGHGGYGAFAKTSISEIDTTSFSNDIFSIFKFAVTNPYGSPVLREVDVRSEGIHFSQQDIKSKLINGAIFHNGQIYIDLGLYLDSLKNEPLKEFFKTVFKVDQFLEHQQAHMQASITAGDEALARRLQAEEDAAARQRRMLQPFERIDRALKAAEKPTPQSPFFAAKAAAAAATPAKESSTTRRLPAQNAAKPK